MKKTKIFSNQISSKKVMMFLLIAMANLMAVPPVSANPLTTMVKVDTRLFNSSNIMLDANVVVFDVAYSNAVDFDDAFKMSNAGENLAIQRGSSILVVEGRQPAAINDVVPFRMWNMHQQNYRIELVAANLVTPGLSAFLEDAYLNTKTLINPNGSTSVNFTVNSNSGSSAMNRFRIIFRQAVVVLPVTFISISAIRSPAGVQLNWKVAEEKNISRYEVQRSHDGMNFIAAGTVMASGNSSIDLNYHLFDGAVPLTVAFYRINSVGTTGESKYSSVVKISAADGRQGLAVVTNPVENGVINLQFKNHQPGKYSVRLINNAGQMIMAGTISYQGGSRNELINVPATIQGGIYRLQVTGADNSGIVQTVIINR
ncbi:MAG: hypothetical protein IPP72_09580 [Chitinophagaceae bacterium]|nr:hypothetical protein [Chitinophagaceae bacterium]